MTGSKIRKFEEAEIQLRDTGSIHIAEVSDGYHIDVSQYHDHQIRIGIPFPDGGGTCYTYWEDVIKALQANMSKSE